MTLKPARLSVPVQRKLREAIVQAVSKADRDAVDANSTGILALEGAMGAAGGRTGAWLLP